MGWTVWTRRKGGKNTGAGKYMKCGQGICSLFKKGHHRSGSKKIFLDNPGECPISGESGGTKKTG